MKILIYGINYWPELTGIGKYTGEMGAWLAAKGHEVRVVTAPPYYPDWKIGIGYSNRWYRVDQIEDATVWRCPLWVPRNPTGAKRVAHLASFALFSLPIVLYQVLWRPDVVIAIEPTLLCAPTALFVARLGGAKALLHVQDFEIDAALELGLLRLRGLSKLTTGIERWIMSRFDWVSSISPRMVERLREKAVDQDKCFLLPNWVDNSAIFPINPQVNLRTEFGISEDGVVVLYSGNMGQKQGLEIVVDAARLLSERHVLRFILCGQGAAYTRLRQIAVGLTNIVWLPLQPLARLNELLNLADIHLLPQRADAADLVMPSKLTGMFASGRPVVTTAIPGSQVAVTVEGRGIVVEPGNAAALADALLELSDSVDLRREFGRAARAYAVTHWDMNRVLNSFETRLLDVVTG